MDDQQLHEIMDAKMDDWIKNPACLKDVPTLLASVVPGVSLALWERMLNSMAFVTEQFSAEGETPGQMGRYALGIGFALGHAVAEHSAGPCGERKMGYICTLFRGHSGPHLATGSAGQICKRWKES